MQVSNEPPGGLLVGKYAASFQSLHRRRPRIHVFGQEQDEDSPEEQILRGRDRAVQGELFEQVERTKVSLKLKK